MPVKSPAPKVAVKVPVSSEPAAVLDAKAISGATAALTDAEGFRRVSTRTNKRSPPLQPEFNYKRHNNYFTIIVVVFACQAAAVRAQDVIVLSKLYAVAQKIGKVAVDLGLAQFPMVLRLVIHDTVHHNKHPCLTINLARHSCKKKINHLLPTWIYETSQSTITLSRHRNKRSPILD